MNDDTPTIAPIFPDTPRVFYDKNPLKEVLCQLRFPRILKIEAQPPVDFQEAIRGEFPGYKEIVRHVPPFLPPELAGLTIQTIGPSAMPRTFQFSTADDSLQITLTSEFIAASTSKYTCWEEFRRQIESPVRALISIYKPGYLSRIGLRYRDEIQPDEIGLSQVGFKDLLATHIASELAIADLKGQVRETEKRVVFQGDDKHYQVVLSHGFAQEEPRTYVLDSDFALTKQLEPHHAIAILDQLHVDGNRLFRWCISDRLEKALDPRSNVG